MKRRDQKHRHLTPPRSPYPMNHRAARLPVGRRRRPACGDSSPATCSAPCFSSTAPSPLRWHAQGLGLFTGSTDVGMPSTHRPGSAQVRPGDEDLHRSPAAARTCGRAADHFRYVWKKISGDVVLDGDRSQFTGSNRRAATPNEHRKACLVHPADARFGLGLRRRRAPRRRPDVAPVARTRPAPSPTRSSRTWSGPRGCGSRNAATTSRCSIAGAGEPWRPPGERRACDLTGEFYVGLGVSSHDTGRIETATFSSVDAPHAARRVAGRPTLVNTLETISLHSKDRRVAYVTTQPGRIEAPNWFPGRHQHAVFQQRRQAVQGPGGPPGRAARSRSAGESRAGRPRHADAHQQRSRRHRDGKPG